MPPQNHEKNRLHPRNKNRKRYDLPVLIFSTPELENYVKPNKFGDNSVDFSNPIAVKLLNKALLNHYYGIKNWEFSEDNLCPPIPGRADYIHYVADLLSQSNYGRIPLGNNVKCLDIGIGASGIYPIIGVVEYDWNFIGSDISIKSIQSAENIITSNSQLKGKVECRLQENSTNIFQGIINEEEKIEVTICNPPFHSSIEEAKKGSLRKVQNLSGKKLVTPSLNFSGINNELIYKGGESTFIQRMIIESEKFANNCYWFTTLVSKQSNLKGIYKALEKIGVNEIKTIPMGTGNKSTRIIAWTFLDKQERKKWAEVRWKN